MAITHRFAFEDWENIPATCECGWAGLLGEAVFDPETELISFLLCPTCDDRVGMLTNEATIEQIQVFAASGSPKAIAYLKKITKSRRVY